MTRGPSAHGRLERGGRFFFVISHLIITFDLEMRLLCFTSRENPGNCGYFSNGVAAFIFYTRSICQPLLLILAGVFNYS